MATIDIEERRQIVITIRAAAKHAGLLRLDDALEQVLDFLRVADEAKLAIATPQQDFHWYLLKASTQSPLTVTAIAEPVTPGANVSMQAGAVKEATARAFRHVTAGEPLPGWVTPSGASAFKSLLARSANGVDSMSIDFHDQGGMVVIDHAVAAKALPQFASYFEDEIIPTRTAYGEIEGQLLVAGLWYKKPALLIRTSLYGDVWCVLGPELVEKWADETKVSSVWKSRRLIFSGRLIYKKGGKLARIEAETVRERDGGRVTIQDLLDPEFTAGFDPVAYIERLHEGGLG